MIQSFAAGLAVLVWLAFTSPAMADGIMLVRAGAFWMGRDDGPPDERPAHRVFVGDFWIDRRPYPWGTRAPASNLAVFGRRYNATEPGGRRPDGRSPYGIEDMLGNLREWTATSLAPYPYRPDGWEPFTAGPGAAAGRGDARRSGEPSERVIVRGASHADPADTLHVTTRHSYDRRGAAAGHHHVGFRCTTSEDLGEMAPGGR